MHIYMYVYTHASFRLHLFPGQESILEEKERRKEERSWKLITLRTFTNFLVLLLLGSSAYAVILVVARGEEPEAQKSWYRQNEVTLVLTGISNVYPNFFDLIGELCRTGAIKYKQRCSIKC